MPGPPARLPLVLAAILPVLVVGTALGWLGAARERPKSDAAVEMEGELTRAAPVEVVVVGNSKARTDLDLGLLGKALGVKPQNVVALDVPASTAPSWYAVLANRVYANGHRPKLVVVYGPLTMMLDTRVYGAVSRMRLEEHLGAVEPVLGPKVLGRSGGATLLDRARERRTEEHAALMDGLKGAAVGMTLAEPGEGGLVERGNAVADPALERLFSGEQQDRARHRTIPVVEEQGPLIASQATSAADSLLADFVALAEANGSRVVFVRAPLAPSERASDAVAPAEVRAVVQTLNELGAGWADLSAVELPTGAFRDALHLNQKGRVALTQRLGADLVAMGALSDGALAPATTPLAPSAVTREGAPPALPAPTFTRTDTPCGFVAPTPSLAGLGDGDLAALGLGPVSPVVVTQDGAPLAPRAARAAFADTCGGAFAHFGREIRLAPTDRADAEHAFAVALSADVPMRTATGEEAWWVYPGTTLRWAFPDPQPAVEVEAWVRVVGPPGEAAPELRVGGAAVPLTGGAARRARVRADGLGEGWTIEVAGQGAWMVIDALVVRGEGPPVALVGAAPTPARILEGKLEFAAAPPAVSGVTGPVPDEGPLRRVEVPGSGLVDDATTQARLGVRDCSPYRLAWDGTRLTAPGAPPADVARLGGGRYAHVGDRLLFGAPNERAPATEGHAWTVTLDERRSCEAGRWVYPGDAVKVAAPIDGLRKLRWGAEALTLTGAAFGEGAPVRVRLLYKGEARVDEEVPAARWEAGPVTWTLDPPLPPRPNPVVLEIASSSGAPFLLLSDASLSAPPPPLSPGSAE